mgnify:CR=1 FL=1
MRVSANVPPELPGDLLCLDERARARLGPAAALLTSFPQTRLRSGAGRQPDLSGLAAVQGSIMRNYFRLLRAQEELERRARGVESGSRAVAIQQMDGERARLAHELHSGAGQALAGIKIHLELIDQFLENPPEQVRGSLHRIGLLAQEALQQVRSIARRVHPPDWERLTLAQALEQLWDVSGIPRKFEASLSLGAFHEPPAETRILIYRVAQEALANAVRHSAAGRLRLGLTGGGGAVRLTVEDNGKGFDLGGALAASGGGIGLRSMRDQVRLAGGELRIESGAGGTRVTACVPLAG